jgi:LPS export ABC transporter protein LptC
MRVLPLGLMAGAFASGAILSSCDDEKHETIAISADPETFPTMKTLDVTTFISDSGYTRYKITSPIWLMFEEAKEPHWSFPKGIYLEKYDNKMKENGSFTADTAYYYSMTKLWRFDKNVRMKNVAGDKFLTQQLYWDQTRRKLYSDSFIHIERSDRIIEGYGFESNDALTEYTIRKPSGIFPTGDFSSK